VTFGSAGADGGTKTVFTCNLAEEGLPAGSPGEAAEAITGLTVPDGLAGAVSGINAGLIFDLIAGADLVAGAPLAGCTAGLWTDCAGDLAAVPVEVAIARDVVGALVAGEANTGLAAVPDDTGFAGGCSLASAFAFTGLASKPMTRGLADGWAEAFSEGLSVSSPRNFSSLLSLIAARIQVIQMGRAARAPVSFSPKVWLVSKPTQTPQVTDGEKPMNQASV